MLGCVGFSIHVAAKAAKRAISAATGGKRATVAAKAAKRSICRYAAKCRRGRQERTEKKHVAALSDATLATVRSSKKVSVCQGRAAFGGCFANLDSLPPFCKELEAARVKGIFAPYVCFVRSPTPRSPSRARARLTG